MTRWISGKQDFSREELADYIAADGKDHGPLHSRKANAENRSEPDTSTPDGDGEGKLMLKIQGLKKKLRKF